MEARKANPVLGDSLTSLQAIVKDEPQPDHPIPTPAASPPKPYEPKSDVFVVHNNSFIPSQSPQNSASSRADALLASVLSEQNPRSTALNASTLAGERVTPNNRVLPAAADGGAPNGTNGVVVPKVTNSNGDPRLAPQFPTNRGFTTGMQTPVLGSGLSAEDSGELLRKLFELSANAGAGVGVGGGTSGLYTAPQQQQNSSSTASEGTGFASKDPRLAFRTKSPTKVMETSHSHDSRHHHRTRGSSSVGRDGAESEESSANGGHHSHVHQKPNRDTDSKQKRHEFSHRNIEVKERHQHQWGDNPLTLLEVPNLPLEIQKEILKRIEADHADLVIDVAQCEEKLEACASYASKLMKEVADAEAALATKKEALEVEKKEKHKIEGVLRWLTKKMVASKEDVKAAKERLRDLERAEERRRKSAGYHENGFEGRSGGGGEGSVGSAKVEMVENPEGRRMSHASASHGDHLHPPYANGAEPYDRPHLKRSAEEPQPGPG
ncbi:hypothetical protein HK097_001215, partial [Rhizophlyctis rosea]